MKKSLFKKITLITLLVFFTILLTSQNIFAAKKIKMAHINETTTPYHKWAIWAANKIKKKTQGRYEVKVYPASSLGDEADIYEGLSLGTIDIGYIGFNYLATDYGDLAISGAPFFIRDAQHWKAYIKSSLFNEISEGYHKKTGNVIAAAAWYGFRHVTSKKPINTPSDMRYLKIRVPNAPLYFIFPQSVNANPTPIAFAEVYLALKQGVVDAQENPLPTIQAKKFYEVQKYINLTGHMANSISTVLGKPLLKKLSPKDQKIFISVFQEASSNITEDIISKEKSLISWFKKKGNIINPVNKKLFKQKVLPFMNKSKLKTWSDETQKRLEAIQ